ncbi:hypothetical protein DAI22_03g107400 [Oryza sativa Japonica Group]|nr:hypothetical protein DAI22_03g107400 [Oryza sativa Japonica Group]
MAVLTWSRAGDKLPTLTSPSSEAAPQPASVVTVMEEEEGKAASGDVERRKAWFEEMMHVSCRTASSDNAVASPTRVAPPAFNTAAVGAEEAGGDHNLPPSSTSSPPSSPS